MHPRPEVSLFCGSAPAHTPALLAEIGALAQQLAARQANVRMGGMAGGLMAQCGQAMVAAGVPLTLVYPATHTQEAAVAPHPLVQHQVVANLPARLRALGQSNVCIALPGGLGTWHELLDLWLHLRPGQRLLVLNHADYYTPLQQLFANANQAGYLGGKRAAQVTFGTTVAELEPYLA